MKYIKQVMCDLCLSLVSDGVCSCGNVAVVSDSCGLNIFVDDLKTIELRNVIYNDSGRLITSEKVHMLPMINLKEELKYGYGN